MEQWIIMNHPGLKNKTGHIGFLGHGSVVNFRKYKNKRPFSINYFFSVTLCVTKNEELTWSCTENVQSHTEVLNENICEK